MNRVERSGALVQKMGRTATTGPAGKEVRLSNSEKAQKGTATTFCDTVESKIHKF